MILQRTHCACIMWLSKNNNWHISLESLIIKHPEEANANSCCNMAEINQWPPSTGQRPNYSRVNYQPSDCLFSRRDEENTGKVSQRLSLIYHANINQTLSFLLMSDLDNYLKYCILLYAFWNFVLLKNNKKNPNKSHTELGKFSILFKIEITDKCSQNL